MYIRFPFLSILKKYSALLFVTFFLLISCNTKTTSPGSEAKNKLKIADSLIIADITDTGRRLLEQAKTELSNSDPAISSYYRIKAGFVVDKPDSMNLYADSALAVFGSNRAIKNNPNDYFKALLVKGDACFRAKNYIAALNYYYKAKKALSNSNCDNGELESKMGSIYYAQKNFVYAARYWADCVHHLELCHDEITPRKLFDLKQGAINNVGFSYERAGFLDSAYFYYLKNQRLIDSSEKAHVANDVMINSARMVLYDNLGGLTLKKGALTAAEKYLIYCINIPSQDQDGIRIPPLLKLAEVYLIKQDYEKAGAVFKRSRTLLDRFEKDNADYEIKWNRLYAEYLFKLHQADEAYKYQDKYTKLRDSVDNNSAELYRLDVERELSGISQQQELIELGQKDKIRIISLAAIGSIVILSAAIIILINRNLRRERKNNKTVITQNEQLRHTLDELERVNKNYIRIMRVMAHDLRNPLSGMTGLAANLLDEEAFNEETKHLLQLIETTGIHTMEMINELLKSGLEDENAPLEKEAIDLQALLYDSVELLQFKANEKQQQIIFAATDHPIITVVNHENIWRVFNNLIVNAIKFSHPKGIINVSIKAQKNSVLVAVADNGIGIPEKDKNNIFEMFTPAKKAGTQGEEPFGLGLSISKRIIERHGGKIWFENNLKGGTIFFIELPV